jgi:prolyl-tRNA synthetase
VEADLRENYTPGYKFNDWELRGVPVRIEIGPRDIENNVCILVRRDTLEKYTVSLDNIENEIEKLLKDIQKNMFYQSEQIRNERTSIANNLDEFIKNINEKQGYIKTMWCGDIKCEDKIKDLTGAHSRCIPFVQENLGNKCVCCGKNAKTMIIWGRQY